MSNDSLHSTVLLRSERSDEEVAIIEITVPAGWPGPPLHSGTSWPPPMREA